MGWPLCDSDLRFQRQRATQGLVSLIQGCDRGKQNKPNHNTSANYCLVDTTQLNLNSENSLLFWLLWGAQICTLQQLGMPAIICASKKWSSSLRPALRYQNPAVHLESLKSLNVESLTVIICKYINASLGCHNHMKGRVWSVLVRVQEAAGQKFEDSDCTSL